MKDILWLVKKTLSVTFRKKSSFILYFLLPMIGIFISLLAYGSEQKTILHIGIVDQDESQLSEDTILFLKGLENVSISKIDQAKINNKLTSGDIDSVITFGKNYSESILNGSPESIQLTSIKGAEVTSYVKSYLYQYIDNIATLSKAANGDKSKFEKMYTGFNNANFNMTTKSITDTSKDKDMSTQTIGFLLMIMLFSAGNLSEIILLEKVNRTYYRLLSTPISSKTYIFSNTIVNLIVMTLQVLVTLISMRYIFHIGVQIPFLQMFAVMFIFCFIAVGISLVIVSFSNSRSTSNALLNLIVIPTSMLSGCFWPAEFMPTTLQKISQFLPQRWTLSTLTQLQEGATFRSLYLNIIILFAFAFVFFLIAIYKFSRNNSTRNFI